MKPTRLPPDKLHQVLNRVPASFKQAQRLIEYLANNPQSVTVDANKACAIGNLSDVAHKVNPYLQLFGLMISCERPPVAIPNRFSEPSNMYLWSIYEYEEYERQQGINSGVFIA